MSKIVLITGATSGIGKATSIKLAQAGHKIIACGRRQDRLMELVKQFDETTILPLCFNISKQADVLQAINSIPEQFKPIDVLINNAGNAHGLDFVDEASVDDWEAMIDINVKGLLYVSKPIMQDMAARKDGHIINIGSIAGIEVYPKGHVYCASKHAVDAISKGMRIDLNRHGVKVSEIKPGLVETEFSDIRFKGDKLRAKQVYDGCEALQAEDIAELILFMINCPKRVNLADVLVLPLAQASITVIKRDE